MFKFRLRPMADFKATAAVPPAFATQKGSSVFVSLHIKPGARESRITGPEGACLGLQVILLNRVGCCSSARRRSQRRGCFFPEPSKSGRLFHEVLGVRKRDVSLVSGQKSRFKTVSIPCNVLTLDQLVNKLANHVCFVYLGQAGRRNLVVGAGDKTEGLLLLELLTLKRSALNGNRLYIQWCRSCLYYTSRSFIIIVLSSPADGLFLQHCSFERLLSRRTST